MPLSFLRPVHSEQWNNELKDWYMRKKGKQHKPLPDAHCCRKSIKIPKGDNETVETGCSYCFPESSKEKVKLCCKSHWTKGKDSEGRDQYVFCWCDGTKLRAYALWGFFFFIALLVM